MRRKGFTLFEVLMLFVIFCIFIAIIFGCIGGCQSANGYVDGRITSTEYVGNFWTTKECVVVTGNVGYHTFQMSVYNQEFFESLKTHNSNEMLRFFYRQYPVVLPWNGSTKFELYKVEKIK